MEELKEDDKKAAKRNKAMQDGNSYLGKFISTATKGKEHVAKLGVAPK